MKKLIIAEKPSLAKNISAALKIYSKKNGFSESENYIITWAYGHLFELKKIKDYLNVQNIKWKDISLPYIPNKFEFILKADDGIKKQFAILKQLINRDDITEIINCGDADREGQLIIDLILDNLNVKKPIKRLWLPEQTEETIKNQMQHLEDNNNYKNLKNEGLGRTYLDWLLGINLTTFLTVQSGKLLRVGRVLIPIVKFIYDRDINIRNFKVENYYQIESKIIKDGVEILLSVKDKKFKESEENEAIIFSEELNKNKAIISSIENKDIKKYPSKLFSLSKLQSFLSKHHKINFTNSEKIIQDLYLKGYITYPRTSTEYLAENEKDKIRNLLEKLSEYDLEFKNNKKIFDDTKIESHSAITITTKIPDIEKDLVEENYKIIYKTIFNRFISNFLREDTIIAQIMVNIKVGEENFELKGETIKQEGFLKYESQKIENNLPNFIKDEEFAVNFMPIKKKTSASKKVTEEELANFLKNPFRTEKTTEDEEYKAMHEGVEIGTEATRTGIIENAKEAKYISQKKNTYSIEPLGEKLIEILDQLNINLYKERTVDFSKQLKKIYKGEAYIDDIVETASIELKSIISNKNNKIDKIEESKEILGKCPICSSDIYIKNSDKGTIYYCNNKDKCHFILWEKTKIFGTEVKITKSKAKSLIQSKNTLFKLHSKLKNIDYDAYIIINGIKDKFVQFKINGFPSKK
ncbi:MAG: DNA topoisomerase [Fusobacteriaceae bacterium]|jgi:DNA topoisomerase-3|nr:DNA topoisomerase [Fusobacteriaceae bacterium]